METDSKSLIKAAVNSTKKRGELWIELINSFNVRSVVEVGVFRGDFAQAVLSGCEGIEKYYMVDPWRNLDNWNKPANVEDDAFEGYYRDSRFLHGSTM